jgi:hypothetical protein
MRVQAPRKLPEDRLLQLRDPVQDPFFPLSLTCRWQDGTSTQQLLPIVNPLISLLRSVAMVLVVLGLLAMSKSGSRTPASEADDRA